MPITHDDVDHDGPKTEPLLNVFRIELPVYLVSHTEGYGTVEKWQLSIEFVAIHELKRSPWRKSA